jgi:hypothetical protein
MLRRYELVLGFLLATAIGIYFLALRPFFLSMSYDFSDNEWRAIGFAVVGIGVVAFQAFRFVRARNKEKSEQQKWDAARGDKRAAASLRSVIDGVYAYKEALTRENERRFFGETITFLALIAAAGVATLQWQTLEKTDSTLRAQQRPWMRYQPIELVLPLTFDGTNFTTKIRYHLENTGHTPALSVIPHARLVVNGLLRDDEQKQLCEPASKNQPHSEFDDQGFVSFPGLEPVMQQEDISVPIKGIDMSPYINSMPPPRFIFFTVASCLTYKFSFGSGEPHQTGIVFNLLSKSMIARPVQTEDDAVMLLAIPFPFHQVPKEEIHTTVSHRGSYAY